MADDDLKEDQGVPEDRSMVPYEGEQEPLQRVSTIPPVIEPGGRTRLKGVAALDDVFRLFNVLYTEERTGILRLRSGETGRDLWIVHGKLMDVRSDPFDPSECLGRVLQRAGIVGQDHVVESLRRAADGSVRQGQALIDLGLLSEPLLDRTLKGQIETKLYPLFEWDKIKYEFVNMGRIPHSLAMAAVELPWLVLQLVWKRYPFRDLKVRLQPLKDKFVGRSDRPIYPMDLYDLGGMLSKFWNEVLSKDQQWQRLLIISNLKESQTHSAVWAFTLTGALVWMDKPREDTAAIRLEKIKEESKNAEKYNHFERLHVHWSADGPKVEAAWARLRDELKRNADESTGLEQIYHKNIWERTIEAYNTLKSEHSRKEYRAKIYDEFFLEFNSDIFRQKGEGYLYTKEDFDNAIEEMKSAIEVYDREGEYYSTLGLALFLKNFHRSDKEAQEGRNMLKKGVNMRPNSESNQICLGIMYKVEGKKQLAMEAFERAMKINPSSRFAKTEMKEIQSGKRDESRQDAISQFLDRKSDRDRDFDERIDNIGPKKKR